MLGHEFKKENILKTIFSTSQVHPRDRFEFWHTVACKNLVDHESSPGPREEFHAEMQSEILMDIHLVLFENSAMDVSHTRHHVARTNSEYLFVCRQVAGNIALDHSSREIVLTAGDITLIDPLLPYTAKFSSDSKLLVLKVPRRALKARVGETREIICRSIGPTDSEGSLLSTLLGMLPAHSGDLSSAAKGIIRNQVVDLTAVSIARVMGGQRARISSARSLVLLNLHTAIDARLPDPGLDPKTVAAAAGVSVRYANAVLAEEGTSIVRLVQENRLARCRSALEDPSQAHRTVSEIAFGWGFSDMTHFGRRFKRVYGMLPSDCRRGVKRT